MNELIIDLSETNPSDFFGVKNKNLSFLKRHFPKLKIVARGGTMKVYGDEEQLEEFDKRMEMLLTHFSRYNAIDENVIERLLMTDGASDYKSEKIDDVLVHGNRGLLIKPKTDNQRKLVDLCKKNDLVFAIGPAGTGKTYIGVAMAVKALKEKQVKRIIITRPAVEAGENLGFLPGDLKEKLDPYMQPIYDALRDMIPNEKLGSLIEKGTIQIAPLAFMRGRTLDNAYVILDEAQNTTHAQMKMFLTRMGKNAKFFVTGDPGQIDLPRRVISGLKEALLILKETEGVGMMYLDDKDVVRHRLVKKVIEAYKHIENRN
ncbi:phosphate starvonation-inducible protein PhoH [Nonlabens tegetincola]|uniref:PhoH-like protein n=1 Tax=Nonlabens tegetincola TaxID=323273 RepID=A0A090QML6_9FLAO|nr:MULTISPECIES: PhoH family protein [Nonlabens]ALM20231.1 phosphate starvation protein PhoH [Nonlabens sp. MIC269]ARN70714.1 PhoH family protein [Nonlabens tegetincola]PQJ18372.1 phosphate starvation-inducible protein PhoH [Nonlabens tegetincola]GAK96781.1 phosphate starvonation-inducible protein PhoH [Nonlabens tegetincola]